jgi:two-component system, LytTR family, response regulator LytT
MRILLVDDEFLALNLLEEYASRIPGLQVVNKVKSGIQALEILEKEPIDVLFLDIQMPMLSGVNLLRALPKKPITIFTTAYSEYAVEAFDLNVVDYLLKPYSFERFIQAVNKAKEAIAPPPPLDFIVVKVDGRLQKIQLSELLYVEGLKEYVKLVSATKQYVTFERLKNIADMLPEQDFLRVHKSYIVAKHAVHAVEGNLLDLGKVKIPISREKKEEVVKSIFGV